MGIVVEVDDPKAAFAFDVADRFIGAFPTRRLALAAVSARHRHDRDGGGL